MLCFTFVCVCVYEYMCICVKYMCICVYVSVEATGGLALLFCFNPLRTGPLTQHGSS